MEKQNITLSVPKELLLKVKLIAVKRHTSVSGLLTDTLQHIVRQDDAYARARDRHLQRLRKGSNLGTRGRPAATREELHDRP